MCSVWPATGGTEHKEAYTWIPPDASCVFCPYSIVMYPLTAETLAVTTTNYMLSPMNSLNVWLIFLNLHLRICLFV